MPTIQNASSEDKTSVPDTSKPNDNAAGSSGTPTSSSQPKPSTAPKQDPQSSIVKIISRLSLKPKLLTQHSSIENTANKRPVEVQRTDSVPSVVQPPQVIVTQPVAGREPEELFFTQNPLNDSDYNLTLETYGNPLISSEATTNIGKLTDPSAPPSYSTVIRLPPPPERRRIPVISESFSFTGRVAPPTYAEVQGIWADSASSRSSEEMVFGPDPQYAGCPRCSAIVITETRSSTSKLTHLTAMGLCILGCWPCCLLPYFIESCKDTYHYCPLCHHCFGVYRPW